MEEGGGGEGAGSSRLFFIYFSKVGRQEQMIKRK